MSIESSDKFTEKSTVSNCFFFDTNKTIQIRCLIHVILQLRDIFYLN